MAARWKDENGIQVLSDIHLEMPMVLSRIDELLVRGTFDALKLKPERRISCLARTIVLLGDVVTVARIERLQELVEYLYQMGFRRVVYIPGNHEYYTKAAASPDGVDELLRAHCLRISEHINAQAASAPGEEKEKIEVIFLNKGALELSDERRLLGCTLWTHVPEQSSQRVEGCIGDYRSIYESLDPLRLATASSTNAWHAEHRAWIRQEIGRAKEDGKQLLVCTHHKPTLKWPARQHLSAALGERAMQKGNDVAWAFQSDCDDLMDATVVKAWFYAHDHATIPHFDPSSGLPIFVVNGVPLFSNQLGYITKSEATQLLPGGLNEGFDGSFLWKE